MKGEVIILGGGITGVTTGIVLRLLGKSTRILCRHWLGDADSVGNWYASDPRFASQYPAASIIPHTVEIDGEFDHMRISRRFFEALHFTGAAGVRVQRHYEVFESPQIVPSYATSMPGFRPLPNSGEGEVGSPRRDASVGVFGWSFDTHFVEMPRYRALLSLLYRSLGGCVETGRFVTSEAVDRMDAECIVNCAGAWGGSMWGDTTLSRFVRGVLVRVHAGGRLPRCVTTNELFSYNYHPLPSVYARPDGSAADVYFYPRTDGWLLGGTRLESKALDCGSVAIVDDGYTWAGEAWHGDVVSLPQEGDSGSECHVPLPIVRVNRELIKLLTGFDIEPMHKTAMTGYRHRRDRVRLETGESGGQARLVHNYGHGGAGVTLSWSCAIHAVALALGLRVGDVEPGLESSLVEAIAGTR